MPDFNSETWMVLAFAAALLILLIVLIVITIKVMKSGKNEKYQDEEDYDSDDIYKKKSGKKSQNSKNKNSASDDGDDEYSDDEDSLSADDSDEENNYEADDVTSRMVREASETVNAARSEAVAANIKVTCDDDDDDEWDDESDDETEENSEIDLNLEPTNKLDTTKIEEALKKSGVSDAGSSDEARHLAEDPDYDASNDSAFFDRNQSEKPKADNDEHSEKVAVMPDTISDASAEKVTVNPVNIVNINTVNNKDNVNTTNPEAGINDMGEMQEFLNENPVPKKKKRKIKKKDQMYEDKFQMHGDEISVAKYFWYNNQDITELRRKEDMYFYCHYFNDPEESIIPLVTEMYDCAFVRTEEIGKIAFGINFRSIGMKEIMHSSEDMSFDKSAAQKNPTEADKEEIYSKWCDYVDNFLKIIVINAPEKIEDSIKNALYNYGHNDPEVLLHSPM